MTEPKYKSAIARALFETDEPISVVGLIRLGDEAVQSLHEGKWISGRYPDNIRVDRNTHFASTDAAGVHAHVYGRRDRDNALVVVRADGSKSHNRGGLLHKTDAEALRGIGFDIPADNLVEVFLLARAPGLILNEAFAGIA